jgi:hypothetical protein
VDSGLGAVPAASQRMPGRNYDEREGYVKRIYLFLTSLAVISSSSLLAASARANTLQVGPGKQYAAPCAAIAAASDGDTIQIDSGATYSGDVCAWSTNNLTLVGVGSGRAVLNAAGQSSQGKAIWVISGSNTVIENIEFTGATVPDNNGAGIRSQGTNLTIRNCYFHDNQEGILTDGGNSTILIEFSEFYHNGAGDGFSHNLYIGNITKFIFRYNYSHGAIIGHLLKSRAAENDIYYNRITDETAGTASYEIDLPNGGLSYIVGNLVEKGPNGQNSALVTYQEEGANSGNPDHELFVVNNTMVNDFGRGTFVVVDSSVTVPAIIKNNIFQGSGTVTTQSTAVTGNNFAGNALLVSPTTYDYHLQSGSPAIDAGANPGQGSGVSLTPVYQYVHPLCAEGRVVAGNAIDIGAYEFNGGTGVAPPNAPPACGAGSAPTPVASLAPVALTFGSQSLATKSSGQSVTLTNTGSAALAISGISIGGTNSSDFSQTNTCGTSLSAGATCAITVFFTPSASGTRSGSLSVSDNAAGSPQMVALSGTGAASLPIATLSPSGLAFATQAPGTTSTSQVVTLTNSGSASLTISNISTSGDFGQTNNCGASLPAGAHCAINVTFSPAVGGARTGLLSVSDDAMGTPQTASLTGTGSGGAPIATVSPASLVFSAQLVGSSSTGQQVKLSNTGNAALTISTVTAAGDFSQTNTCGTNLGSGSSCSITISFRPAAGGTRTGTITISDNSSTSSQIVSLSGAGMDFSLSTSVGSPSVSAGQTATDSLAVSPDGGFNQPVILSCGGAPADSVCSVSPGSITPSGTSVSSASVSITTTARSWYPPAPRSVPPRSAPLRFVVLLFMILLFLKARERVVRRVIFAFCTVLFVAGLGVGCAGVVGSKGNIPGSGTPAGSYTLILTGTSGSLTHSTSVVLKVN